MRNHNTLLLWGAILWSRAKAWSHPLAPLGLAHRALMRRKHPDNSIFGISVYVFKSDYDLSKSVVLLNDAFDLIKEKSPVLVEILKRAYKSIILYIAASPFRYFSMDRCLMINALTLPKLNGNQLQIHWATEIITVARGAVLLQGRHGYIGIRFIKVLMTRAEIRFVRKCITEENHLFLLSMLNLKIKRIDKLRPERRYYERFLRDDLTKWNFGKNLTVARDGIRIIETDAD
jgi:hypothetical protein